MSDPAHTPIAVLEVESRWQPNKPLECKHCYGFTTIEHPGHPVASWGIALSTNKVCTNIHFHMGHTRWTEPLPRRTDSPPWTGSKSQLRVVSGMERRGWKKVWLLLNAAKGFGPHAAKLTLLGSDAPDGDGVAAPCGWSPWSGARTSLGARCVRGCPRLGLASADELFAAIPWCHPEGNTLDQ